MYGKRQESTPLSTRLQCILWQLKRGGKRPLNAEPASQNTQDVVRNATRQLLRDAAPTMSRLKRSLC